MKGYMLVKGIILMFLGIAAIVYGQPLVGGFCILVALLFIWAGK